MRRLVKILPVLIVFALLLNSCEKDTSLENAGNSQQNNTAQPGTSSGTSLFVMAGAPDNCLTPSINGVYHAGTALDGTNTVTLLINVTTIGTYTIATATTNGIYFSATGTFTTTGIQSVTFQGQGIPIATGTYNFMAGANGCVFAVVVQSGGAVTVDCKSCSYVPMCDGSSYTYIDTTASGVNPPSVSNLTFLIDTTIDGAAYKKFSSSGNGNIYYNCLAGVSTIVTFNSTSMGGVSVARIDQTLLKANSPVGTTWQNSINLGSGITAQYDWSIVAKGIPHTVLGISFPDVIQVHLSMSTIVPLVGTIPSAEGDYYYAKNVGLVDNELYDISSGIPVLQLHRVLQSYFIP
jgi:hypothetical protein